MRVMVISPVFGGAHPIAASVQRALSQLGHEALLVDLRSFQSRYHELRQSAESSEAAGVQFYEEVELHLTHLVVEHTPELMLSMALAPLTQKFLVELRRREIVTASWFVEDCRRFPMWQWQASWFDHFFVIQDEPIVEEVKQAGARNVWYLPNAGDALLARATPLSEGEKSHFGTDICFMGAPYPNRVELFSKLGGFSLGLWGKGWSEHEETLPGVVREGSRLVSPEEESKIYRASKILINLHSSAGDESSQLNDFLNPRTFTAALCGVFQLIDERTLLPQAFDIGPEVVTFSGTEDLCEKLTYFLNHADERETRVRAARERALREHTYEVRMAQALSMMGLSD